MNKIIIPSILGIIVLIAGISAFSPIDEATTVHKTVIQEITQDVSGSSLIIETTLLTSTFTGSGPEDKFQYVILESAIDEIFTVKEVEIALDLDIADDPGDRIDLREVYMMQGGYASTKAGIEAAQDDDKSLIRICDTCSDNMLDGNDTLDAITWSYMGYLADSNQELNLTVGPGSKLIFEIEMVENGDDLATMGVTLTFYLSGPNEATDIIVTELEDEPDNTFGA